jgi:hypothetical protein
MNRPKNTTSFRPIFYSPEDARLRAGWRLFFHFLILIFFSILFSLPFAGLVFEPGARGPVFFLVNGLITAVPVTVSVYLARRWLDRRPFAGLGLHWNGRAAADLLLGFGLTGLMFALIFLLEWAPGFLQFEGFAWQAQPLAAILQGTFLMLLAYIFTGWGEELLFRGYWLQNISEGLNLSWGIVITSVLFALAHLLNPSPSLAAVLGLILGGLFFAFAYVRTGQLWLPIGIHIGWNFFEGTIFGFQVSGTEPFSLVRQTVQGPEIITGGAFGPEAGLVLLPALLLGALLIHIYTRTRKAENHPHASQASHP